MQILCAPNGCPDGVEPEGSPRPPFSGVGCFSRASPISGVWTRWYGRPISAPSHRGTHETSVPSVTCCRLPSSPSSPAPSAPVEAASVQQPRRLRRQPVRQRQQRPRRPVRPGAGRHRQHLRADERPTHSGSRTATGRCGRATSPPCSACRSLPSLAGGTDFAFGGATTGTPGPGRAAFRTACWRRPAQYLGATGNVASPSALYVDRRRRQRRPRGARRAIGGGADSGGDGRRDRGIVRRQRRLDRRPAAGRRRAAHHRLGHAEPRPRAGGHRRRRRRRSATFLPASMNARSRRA